jgi:hypothetical protein
MACGCHRPPSLWALLSLCCAVVIIPILGCEYSLPLSLCFGDQNVLYILFAAITCSSSSYCTLPAAVDPRHRFRAPAHYPHAGPANLLYFGLAHALGTDSITVSAGDWSSEARPILMLTRKTLDPGKARRHFCDLVTL